jgi:hypothetical protein
MCNLVLIDMDTGTLTFDSNEKWDGDECNWQMLAELVDSILPSGD